MNQYHILFFKRQNIMRNGVVTAEKRWQAVIRHEGGNTVTFIPEMGGFQPTSEKEFYLVVECDGDSDVGQEQSVRLLNLIAVRGEVVKRIFKTQKDGRLASKRIDGNTTILYVPDREGITPNNPHSSWLCEITKPFYMNSNGNFIIIGVKVMVENLSERAMRRRARKNKNASQGIANTA